MLRIRDVRCITTIVVWAALCVAFGAVATAAAPNLIPAPKRLEGGEGRWVLPPGGGVALAPGANEVELYAASVLAGDLRTDFGFSAPVHHDGPGGDGDFFVLGAIESLTTAGEVLSEKAMSALAEMPDDQGFVIETIGGVEGKRPRQVWVVGSGPTGALYGALTVSQMLEREGGDVRLPAPLFVADWPSIATRGYAWFTRDSSVLDWMARSRMNAMTYKQFLPFSVPDDEPWHVGLPREAPFLRDACHKRGILFYAGTAQRWVQSFWSLHPEEYGDYQFRISDERVVEFTRRMFEQFGEMGVDGFVLMLDDITQHASPEELGREHVEWVRLMAEIGRKHGVGRLLMCPTHYWKGWSPDYYRPFREATDLADVGMIFCPFDAHEITRVKEAGLTVYEWWHNGVWPLGQGEWVKAPFAGLVGGLDRVEWGWYGEVWPDESLVNEFRTLHERTQSTWGNVGNHDLNWPVWGAYLWNPPAYDPVESEARMADLLFGRGAREPYMKAMEHIRDWAERMQTPDDPERDLMADTRRAREEVKALKDVVDQSERPGFLPVEKRRHYWWLIDGDLDRLIEKAWQPLMSWNPEPMREGMAPEIKLMCRHPESRLFCTMNGADPTTASKAYEHPLPVGEDLTVRVKVFDHEGNERGSMSRKLTRHDANGCPVVLANDYAPQYHGGGESALTDGARGGAGIDGARWQGFEGVDLDATIDLLRPIEIKALRLGCLQSQGQWIFLPRSVTFELSEDGERFSSYGPIQHDIDPRQGGVIEHDFTVRFKDKGSHLARYIRVKTDALKHCPAWHKGEGSKSWLFVDELLVNAPADLVEPDEEEMDMTIIPWPKKMDTQPGRAALAGKPVIGVSPTAHETVRYGAEMLQKDLKTYFNVDAEIDDSGEIEKANLLLGVQGAFPEAEKMLSDKARTGLAAIEDAESYVIEVTCADDEESTPRAVILGRDPVGAMYGCFTLSQAFDRTEGRLALPRSLYVEDWPVMKTRAQVDAPADASPVSIEQFDRLARWRMNTIYYQHFYPYMSKYDAAGNPHTVEWTHEADPSLPDVMREAHRRGLTVYGAIGARWAPHDFYLGEHLSFQNPEHLEVVLSVFEQLAEAGVDGLLLLFDDIAQNLTSYELGSEHVEWMRRVKEIADRHGIGDRVMMCPTHYWKGWSSEYFRPFKEATDLRGLRMHFCPYDPESISRVTEAGLTNFEWWQNGVYGLGTGEWVQGPMRVISGGIPRVERCWYGGDSEEVLHNLRTLPERTVHAWLCNGGDIPLAVWSYYLWNPISYRTSKMERDIAEAMLGRGAAEPYAEWLRHMTTWAARVESQEEYAGSFEASEMAARAALDEMMPFLDQGERPGLLKPVDRHEFWWTLARDIRALNGKAYVPVIAWECPAPGEPAEVKLRCRRSGVEMRYTLDGSEPDADSLLYTGPIRVEKTAVVHVRTFDRGEPKGEQKRMLHKHAANGAKITLEKGPSAQYFAGGAPGLIDGVRASTAHSDGRWLGFDGMDMKATIDLGKPIDIHCIRAGFLHQPGPWIFRPEKVVYYSSEDGTVFKELATVESRTDQKEGGPLIEDFEVRPEGLRTRYLRVCADSLEKIPDWHGHAGEESWLFCDEILVNPAD